MRSGATGGPSRLCQLWCASVVAQRHKRVTSLSSAVRRFILMCGFPALQGYLHKGHMSLVEEARCDPPNCAMRKSQVGQ